MNKALSRIILVIEIVFITMLSVLLLNTVLMYREEGRMPSTSLIVVMVAIAISLLMPLLTNLLIRIKHRSNTPEGEMLPLLCLAINFECISYLPIYFIETGSLILDPVLTNVLIRFSFLSASILLIFVSLLLMGMSNNNYNSYLILSLIGSLILSIMAPSSSTIQAARSNFGSDYDIYFIFAITMMTIATITTLVGAAIHDKMRHSIQRCISYILITAGNYAIFILSNTILTMIGTILFVVGSIMLAITSKDSF